MKITDCLWKKEFIEKLEQKHHVSQAEVAEVFDNNPRFDFVAKGRVKGENLYWALGQTDAGRYLTIFFILQASRHGNAYLGSQHGCERTETL